MSETLEVKPRRLATVKETCAYAKMGHTKLYEKINQGSIDAFTRDGRTLVDLDSVDIMNAKELKPWRSSPRARIGKNKKPASVAVKKKLPSVAVPDEPR